MNFFKGFANKKNKHISGADGSRGSYFEKIKVALMLFILFFAVSGCGSTTSTALSGKLVIWGTVDDSKDIDQFVNDFQAQHPNVTVEYTKKDDATYESDLLNALAAGNGPDIFSIHNDWLPKYEDKMVPAPADVFTLKDYSDTYLDVVKDDFVDNGQIYALPLTVDSLALYYNKDILGTYGIASPPKTWNDLRADVQEMTVRNSVGHFTRSGVALGTTANIDHATDILYLLMLQNRTVPYSSDFSESTLDNSITDSSGSTFYPAANALSYYTSFADPSSDVYTWNSNSDYSVDAFANGEVAFMYGYSFTKSQIDQKSPNLNYGIAPVPQPNLSDPSVNFASYYGYGVSKQSKYQEAAWQFIKFMGSNAELQTYYKNNEVPSSRLDLIPSQNNDLNLAIFATANLTAKSFYKKDADAVNQIISTAIDSISLHSVNVSSALETAVQQINLLNH